MKITKQEQEEARKELLATLKPGDTVYTVLRHVSRSGMFRRIDLFTMGKDGPRRISFYAAKLMGMRLGNDCDGIKVTGCGMDMGFHLVYNLGRYLWPEGTEKPHGTRNGEPDKDGGYALNHRWL